MERASASAQDRRMEEDRKVKKEKKREKADLLVHNAVVYTSVIDQEASSKAGELAIEKVTAFAIKDGHFIGVGASKALLDRFEATEVRDLEGACVFPGLIDAHCHFLHYGRGLQWADLRPANSAQDLLKTLAGFAQSDATIQAANWWIKGRGWNETTWSSNELPSLAEMDAAFPDRPIYLVRIDGHAALVNSKALTLAGITAAKPIVGGKVDVDIDSGTGLEKPNGLLIDKAMLLVSDLFSTETAIDHRTALLDAERDCFEVGLTAVHDAGLSFSHYQLIDQLHKTGELKMPIYGMLTPDKETVAHYRATGPYRSQKLHLRSFKYYADGALGSRGARLLADYADDPGNSGLWMHERDYLLAEATLNATQGFQMCTHAIGDAANRLILDCYEEALEKAGLLNEPSIKNKHRWRIEHAQFVHPDDLGRFGKLGVLPSIQATHATSDMSWVGKRVGAERLNRGYQYKSLLESSAGNCLPGGSDFPIESINPLFGFYAAVARRDHAFLPAEGFLVEEALSRAEALLSMTAWAAYAAFEEEERGSIAIGKEASFVVLDMDIMTADLNKLPFVKVEETVLAGERVFKR